jgi:putative colanic acid biosynthesis UDP-glucose lipid carrier transferase
VLRHGPQQVQSPEIPADIRSMFEDRSYKRTFYSAPQSVTSLVAAFLEPTIMVVLYLAVSVAFDEPIVRADLTLCLLVFAITFPGRNRFKESLLAAGVDIVSTWIGLLAIMLLCGYATSSLGYFNPRVLLWWALLTPLGQWVAVAVGHIWIKHHAALPENRRTAVVIGAGPLGVKVARSVREAHEQGIDFVGYFDDRTDERVDPHAAAHRVGSLKEAAQFVQLHAIREVYITLPLGSQPRIVELLEELQGTTASIFFVPDVFGISIIQGRLQDLNGVPIVGMCETPFTGTNELVKRIEDIVLSALILLLISPVLLAVSIGVKMSSPGPVIFRQKRNGLDGEEIEVYK